MGSQMKSAIGMYQIILVGLLLCITGSACAQTPAMECELVYEGEFPYGPELYVHRVHQWKLKPMPMGESSDLLVLQTREALCVLRPLLEDQNAVLGWEELWSQPVIWRGNPGVAWDVGTLAGSADVKLVHAMDSVLHLVEGFPDSIQELTLEFPHQIDDLAVGDLDGDGENEILVFCSIPTSDFGGQYEAFVLELQPDGSFSMSSDERRSGLSYNDIIPRPRLQPMLDLQGLGRKQVVQLVEQSDMVESRYRLFDWREGRLERTAILGIRCPDPLDSFARPIDMLLHYQTHPELPGKILCKPLSETVKRLLVEIRQGVPEILAECDVGQAATMLIQLDGHGMCVLSLQQPRDQQVVLVSVHSIPSQ